jgi:hypothetical protein
MANPWHPWNQVPASPDGKYRVVCLVVLGKGSVISTGLKGYSTPVPYNGTIIGWDIHAPQSGSCVVDVWKDTWANFPPTVADTIAGGEKPTLVAQQKNQDHNLTTWTRDVRKGDVFAFNVESASSIIDLTVGIRVRPD